MKSKRNHKSKIYTCVSDTINASPHSSVIILDTSRIQDNTDYGSMLHELKKIGIRDGETYQIDNTKNYCLEELESNFHVLLVRR